jgi:hypothetical protein
VREGELLERRISARCEHVPFSRLGFRPRLVIATPTAVYAHNSSVNTASLTHWTHTAPNGQPCLVVDSCRHCRTADLLLAKEKINISFQKSVRLIQFCAFRSPWNEKRGMVSFVDSDFRNRSKAFCINQLKKCCR